MHSRDIKEIKHNLLQSLESSSDSLINDSVKSTCADEIARLREIAQLRDDEKFVKELSGIISEFMLFMSTGTNIGGKENPSYSVADRQADLVKVIKQCDLFEIEKKIRIEQKSSKVEQKSPTGTFKFEDFDEVAKLAKESQADTQHKAPLRKTKATMLAARTWQPAKTRSGEEDVKSLIELAKEAKEKRESSSSGSSDEKKDRKPKK